MRLIKTSGKLRLESFLSKKECDTLVTGHRMKSIKFFCERDNISKSLFVLNGFSLDDIYATEDDWSHFKHTMFTFTDPSANALSHYLNRSNDRITTNSVFFTDSTSGVSLLNPRFTYLVNKSNPSLSKSFPDIHVSLSVTSNPETASEIENYYTEDAKNIVFFLNVSYMSDGIQNNSSIKITNDKSEFLTSLKKIVSGRGADKSQRTSDKDNVGIKNNANTDAVLYYKVRYDEINNALRDLLPYLEDIDSLILPKRIMSKPLLEKVKGKVPESLYPMVYSLLKEGELKTNNLSISISNKPIVGKSLKSSLEEIAKSYKDMLDKYNVTPDSGGTEDTGSVLSEYIEAVSERMSDIYDFVMKNPFNSKGNIPPQVLTKFRNKNALIFVLCPTANPSHRCMYISSIGDDVRSLKYSFNAAGTDSNTYSVVDGSIVVS